MTERSDSRYTNALRQMEHCPVCRSGNAISRDEGTMDLQEFEFEMVYSCGARIQSTDRDFHISAGCMVPTDQAMGEIERELDRQAEIVEADEKHP